MPLPLKLLHFVRRLSCSIANCCRRISPRLIVLTVYGLVPFICSFTIQRLLPFEGGCKSSSGRGGCLLLHRLSQPRSKCRNRWNMGNDVSLSNRIHIAWDECRHIWQASQFPRRSCRRNTSQGEGLPVVRRRLSHREDPILRD